jgi:hypothetical protein
MLRRLVSAVRDDSTNFTVTSRAVNSSSFLVFLCLRTMISQNRFNPGETDYYKDLKLCFRALHPSRPFHHLPCFRRRFRKTTLKLVGAELTTRDCPPNIVIADGVGQAVSVRHNCMGRWVSNNGTLTLISEMETGYGPSPYPHPSRYLDDNCDVESSQRLEREYAGSWYSSGSASPSWTIFLSPNRCLSTPWPSAAHAAYCTCRAAAL